MEPYAEDWRGPYRGNSACVVLPATTEQVSQVVRACADARVPVVPQGGNTSLCEGAVPGQGDTAWVVISLQRMRRIRSVDLANNSMTVDAGCVLAVVQDVAAEHGRLYPVSLGAEGSCQIGGNIATNAGGTGVLHYGNTRDNILGLEVVLPDGRIFSGLNGLRKNNVHFIPQASFAQWNSWADPHAMAIRIKHAVNQVAHELGGTFSAEHGIGQALTGDMAASSPPWSWT